MKTAQFRYIQTSLDISVNIYFDLKVFEFIKPPLDAFGEDQFIRQISDSIAAAMPKENAENHFYIKRAIRHAKTNQLKLFCTNGFLIDTALLIPIVEQAFADERIKIIEVEQLPTRLNFSNDIMKIMNDRLPLFEEEVSNDIAQGEIIVAKEDVIKVEKQTISLREFVPDTSLDIFAEIGNIKKEIKEIAESNQRSLNILMKQVNATRQKTRDDIMKDTYIGLADEENKKKLEAFAKYTIGQFGGVDVEKNKELLNNKIEEISPIPNKFENEIEDITHLITKQIDSLAAFKRQLINALYQSAQQYYQNELSKLMQNASPNAKKIMVNEFNKKFAGVAVLSDTGTLTTIDEAQENLNRLSLEQLQDIVSSENKDNPGIMQKCNTSWIEESPELQIVMKNLSHLNGLFAQLFKDNPQYRHYADVDMVQITRIPFPRSFQFSFTSQALEYKNSVDDFCKTQKETIINMSKEYKKAMQIEEIRDKTERAISEIKRQIEMMKKPVIDYKELLGRKEMSTNILSQTNKNYALIEKGLALTNQLQEVLNSKMDPRFKIIKKNVHRLVLDIQKKSGAASLVMKQITDAKSQIDTSVDNATVLNATKLNINEIDEKIKSMNQGYNKLIEISKNTQTPSDKLAIYEQAVTLNERTIKSATQSNLQKQQSEAKNLILNLIKDETRDISSTEEIKKHMIDLYTQIETNFSNIEKGNLDAMEMKNQLFKDLNTKKVLSDEQFKAKLQPLSEKLSQLDATKQVITDDLSQLKKLSLETSMERKEH